MNRADQARRYLERFHLIAENAFSVAVNRSICGDDVARQITTLRAIAVRWLAVIAHFCPHCDVAKLPSPVNLLEASREQADYAISHARELLPPLLQNEVAHYSQPAPFAMNKIPTPLIGVCVCLRSIAETLCDGVVIMTEPGRE